MLAASACLPLPGAGGRIAGIPAFCPFYNLTGLPCPGCGLTRTFVCLGHGRVWESLHWHPIGWLIYAGCLALWLRAGLTWLRGVPLLPVSSAMKNGLSWGALAGLFLVGVARIAWLTAHHIHF